MTKMNAEISKCLNDGEINRTAKVVFDGFYTAARTAHDPKTLFTTPYGAMLRNKSTIVHTKKSRDAVNQLINRVEHLLPTPFANRRTLQTTLPDILAGMVEEELDFKEFKPRLKDFLERALSHSFSIFLPNNLFILNGIGSIDIGPVSIVLLDNIKDSVNEVAASIKAENPEARDFHAKVDEGRLYVNYQNTLDINTPSRNTMWRVEIEAHPEQAREEALWQIRVASRLIGILGQSWSGPKPYGTRLERHPTVKDEFMGDTFLRLSPSHVSVGGGQIYPPYAITTSLKSEIESADSKKLIDAIMSANSKSVGERVYLALGWISVARSSDERPQRLLAAMTALEAIFSRGKDAPVNETISRLGSVVLARTVSDRQSVAKMFKDVYSVRSKIVHNGRREITETQANTALALVQMVVEKIIESVDLTIRAETFISELVSASYGDVWPTTP